MQYSATASDGATVSFAVESLPQAFASIPDPRRTQGRRYSVAAIVSLAVVAVLANHTSVLAMAEWVARQTRHVRRALGFRRDTTPHQTTIARLFARLDPAAVAAAVERVFDPVTPAEVRARGSQGVAVDGKAQRGRLRHGATPTHPIHAVSAFCHDLGGVLAQLVVDAQQQEAELTVAPDVIRQLDWQGRVLTGDALYCQQALCTQVLEYTRTWTRKGQTKQQVRHGITSLPAAVSSAAQLAALKRGHWQIENGLHHVKDVTLDEDASQMHLGAGADVFAMVRNIAVSLIRRSGHRDIATQLRRYSGSPH